MSKNIKKAIISLFVYSIICLFVYSFILVAPQQATDPQSTTYDLKAYGFGSAGVQGDTSTTYSLFGTAGQTNALTLNSTTYTALPGLTYTIGTNVPGAPTVSNNSGQYYNKLSVTLNTSGNPTDTVYAIKVVSSGTQYVQANDTLGNSPVWQQNSVWGASGFSIIGLTPGVAYIVSVSAKQGTYTQSAYSLPTTVSTVNPSFTFSLNNNSISIGQLSPGTVITAATTVTANVTTNGTGGAIVSVYGANNGLKSTGTNYTISSSTTNLASAAEGYGIQGTTTSGAPMEILSPYNVTSSNVGSVTTTKQPIFDSSGSPVTSGQGTFQIMAKAGNATKAASDYGDTITVVASGTF